MLEISVSFFSHNMQFIFVILIAKNASTWHEFVACPTSFLLFIRVDYNPAR